jgi:ADP-ribose pyrophosphatase YjhB (NUDIX family)
MKISFMKKTITLLTVALLLAACQESLEDRCAREAQEYTKKNCPVRVVEHVLMDSMTFDRTTHTIGYAYTLEDLLDDSVALSKAHPRELLLKELKNTPNLKLYKEAGYNFRYIYYSNSKKGTKLFEATFLEKDYR